jgi:glycosyltransferase involved in cell wall biosynthesis
VRALTDGVGAVHFAGEIRDQAAVARYLRVASAVVIPGALGLAVNHALAHGLPVITRDTPLHGPEIEYLTPGKDSFVVQGDQEAFVDTLRTFVRSPELREQMAAAALTSRRRLGLEEMVDTFDRAVTDIAGT